MSKQQYMEFINFIVDNIGYITTAIGGGLGWFLGGRQKQDIELKKSNSDAVKSMQEVYDTFLNDFKQRVADLMIEVVDVKNHNKDLQTQFNDIYIQYAKETEKSHNWEKLHSELAKKYNDLELKYYKLERAFETLKKKQI
jgi:hypothetical protein